jgi:capsular polysaccharide transport system permease protein
MAFARTIFALIIREMATRFGSKPGGYLWAFLDPAAHILLMTAIFSAIARIPPIGSEFLIFFASGFLALQFYTTIASQVAGAIKANKTLLTYPKVIPLDLVIARVVLQFSTVVILSIVILWCAFLYTGEKGRIELLPLLESASVATAIGTGIGMFNVVAFAKAPLYEKAFQIVTRPLFLISGVLILIEDVPSPYREWLLWNPIAHIVMWFRTGIYPYYRTDVLDKDYAVVFAMGALLIGMAVFTSSKRSMRAA